MCFGHERHFPVHIQHVTDSESFAIFIKFFKFAYPRIARSAWLYWQPWRRSGKWGDSNTSG